MAVSVDLCKGAIRLAPAPRRLPAMPRRTKAALAQTG